MAHGGQNVDGLDVTLPNHDMLFLPAIYFIGIVLHRLGSRPGNCQLPATTATFQPFVDVGKQNLVEIVLAIILPSHLCSTYRSNADGLFTIILTVGLILEERVINGTMQRHCPILAVGSEERQMF